jgi:Ni/Co efflux regulator RcnB
MKAKGTVMRKLILSILMATVAVTPAIAERRGDSDREEARSERQQSREDRREAREERQVRAERSVRQSADAPVRAEARADRRDIEQIRAVREGARHSGDGVRTISLQERQQLRDHRRDNRELRQSERPVPHVLRNRVPVVSNTPRPGTQPPLVAERRRSSPVNWSSNWRHNSRYDWYNWRNRHRSLFRLGFYSDPFGWGYQPYSIGWRMWPNYYRTSSFWLNDPWQYRLPYAPAGTRWVRYYDDAILVDTWTGEVVDVIYNFFW